MKKFLFIFLTLVIIQISVFGQDETQILEILAMGTIYNFFSYIDGTTPLPQVIVQISPDTYIFRGNGHGGDERLIVITTNNILGVVSIAITDTGNNSEVSFRMYNKVINDRNYFQLENIVSNSNSIRGTILRDTGGRKYRFSLENHPNNKQFVLTVMRH